MKIHQENHIHRHVEFQKCIKYSAIEKGLKSQGPTKVKSGPQILRGQVAVDPMVHGSDSREFWKEVKVNFMKHEVDLDRPIYRETWHQIQEVVVLRIIGFSMEHGASLQSAKSRSTQELCP
jgi:hypothetical protein